MLLKKISSSLLWFIFILIVFSISWAYSNYGNISFDEILFHLSNPMNGVERSLIMSFITYSLIPSIIVCSVFLIIKNCILKEIRNSQYLVQIKLIKNTKIIKISEKLLKTILFLFLIVFCFIIFLYGFNKIGLNNYIRYQLSESNFIKENYVDTQNIKLQFPEKKKNIIYIFVESLESTYFSNDLGGAQEENLLPELYNLSKNNIHFSNTDKMGGAIQVSNTGYTTAAIVAQTAGIPLKLPSNSILEEKSDSFIPGVYSLGEILEKEGYNQMIMFGSDAVFGRRDTYFNTHGNYTIYDYYTAIKMKKINENYKVWWGFEDSKLFEYAKEEIINLSLKKEPFNFTMLTANTHHIDGYLENDCEQNYDTQYANVIRCTSKQLYEFITWIQQQKFYENTTIVIVGDHLSMNTNFFNNISGDYERTVFNLFINSSINTKNNQNRDFTTLDMFPTTLASMGVKIDGDRLGLGTNLFSDKKTIIEKFGKEKVNQAFLSRSDFYTNKFLYNK